ncbi:hypothetical protein SCP_1002850 [Sparassis crispa]|uniref:Uncharacterized protein n=1 Tax=Sparassis crispa TaxID=139825 RepID=A0A401GXT9_9APHY|nr:hypothetical protein SCP_1002850 [Sparassis crispa]GBE87038.1 hypothetical protein SCP_1002850 [Sparassis crispa]
MCERGDKQSLSRVREGDSEMLAIVLHLDHVRTIEEGEVMQFNRTQYIPRRLTGEHDRTHLDLMSYKRLAQLGQGGAACCTPERLSTWSLPAPLEQELNGQHLRRGRDTKVYAARWIRLGYSEHTTSHIASDQRTDSLVSPEIQRQIYFTVGDDTERAIVC